MLLYRNKSRNIEILPCCHRTWSRLPLAPVSSDTPFPTGTKDDYICPTRRNRNKNKFIKEYSRFKSWYTLKQTSVMLTP